MVLSQQEKHCLSSLANALHDDFLCCIDMQITVSIQLSILRECSNMHIYYENNGDCDRRKCILEMYDIFSIYKIFYVGNHAENDKSAFLGVAKMSNI